MILVGSFEASSIMDLSREAWRDGILPRTLNDNVTSSSWPGLPDLVICGVSNLKGYATLLTMDSVMAAMLGMSWLNLCLMVGIDYV